MSAYDDLSEGVRLPRPDAGKPASSKGRRKTPETSLAGYKKPPVEHRFKPGFSGNYEGRPKRRTDANAGIEPSKLNKAID